MSNDGSAAAFTALFPYLILKINDFLCHFYLDTNGNFRYDKTLENYAASISAEGAGGKRSPPA